MRRTFDFFAFALLMLMSGTAIAQTAIPIKLEAATISVTGSKPSGTTAGGDLTKDWTRVNFSQAFSRTPYVFTVPTIQGSNAGAHRVRNITTTGFYIRSVEPHTFDGTHAGMQVTYLAVEACDGGQTQCEVNIPLSGGGSERWMIGHVDTSRWVGWGSDADVSANWEAVSFSSSSPFAVAPAVLAQVQTIANETGLQKTLPQSRPWLTSAAKSVATGGFSLSLERSEATDKDSVTKSERIAWIAAPPGGRKYLLDANNQPVGYEIIRTGADIKGWNEKVHTSFSSPWTTAPQVIASLNSRNNREPSTGNGTKGDGGWLRRDTDNANNLKTRTGYVVDETHHNSKGQDNNRTKNSGEVAGIFAFERAFSIDPILLDHFRIVHDGAGQTCAPESITVKACVDSNCTSLFGSAVTLGLDPDASDANASWSGTGVSGDAVTFAGGQATVNLVYSKAATITLGATGTPIPINATKCEVNGAVSSCNFSVAQCTIRPFEACDSTTSPCDENGTNLFTKISGGGNVVLNLVKIQTSGANKGKVETGFSTGSGKTVAVDLVSGSALDANTGCPTSPQQLVGSAIGTVSFSSGRANNVVVLPAASNTQAVKDVKVRFVLTQGASSITSCTTDSFAIRPAYLSINSPDATSDKTLPPATPGLVAGSSFSLAAQAMTAGGGASSGYNGTPALDTALVESCMATSAAGDAGNCPNSQATTRLIGSFGAADAPTATASGSFVYDDAGAFQLLEDAVVDASFAAGDAGNQGCVAGDTGNVAGSDPTESDYGKVGCVVGSKASGAGSQSQFGRFYPALYSLDSGAVVAGCGTSTYMGQNFKLDASISARNQGDTKTLTRYRAGRVVLAANRASALGTNLSPGTVSTTDADPTWTNGTATIAWTQIKYAKPGSLTGPVSDLQIGLRVVDDDNRPMKTPDLLTDYKQISGSVPELRFGRLRLSNAFGSEKANLELPVQAHYWSGQSWVPNNADSCTNLPATAFFLVGGMPGNTVQSDFTLAGGVGTLTLTKPSPTATGSVDVAVNLGASGSDQSCLSTHGGTAANLPWLRSQNGNCAATYDRDPSARATFGIYAPESRKSIHVRESY
jgi:hypothetical protein